MNKILDSASEFIFIINSQKKIVLWNKSAEKKSGYSRKNILNKSIKYVKLFEDISIIENFIENNDNSIRHGDTILITSM